jgi:Skp family chaperone for outer membrane proteins
LAQLQETLQSRLKEWNDYVKDRVDFLTLGFYREIKEQVGAFAAQNGYDLILKTDAPDKSDEVALQRAAKVIAYRNKNVVMMDITEDIIKLLNGKGNAAEPGVSMERVKLKIGGINVRKLVENYRKSNPLEKIEEIKARTEEELRLIEPLIQSLQKEIDSLPEDSASRKEKEAMLSKLQEMRDSCLESIDNCAKELKAPYNKIRKAADTIAARNGYDLILRIETPDITDSVTLKITKEGIVYRNKNVVITDITDDIMPWILLR